MPTRRSLLLGSGAGLVGLVARAGSGHAREAERREEIVVPVAVAVAQRSAEVDGEATLVPVVEPGFVTAQLYEANEVFGEHGIRFVEHVGRRTLPETAARLETRADRDALADAMQPQVANVYFVESLRDVDTPSLMRMGVCWRKLSNLAKRYVIVAASAMPTTLAHELGHFLGNGHAYVKNNLMSYERDGGKVFLDAAQARRSRTTAARLLASKELVRVAR